MGSLGISQQDTVSLESMVDQDDVDQVVQKLESYVIEVGGLFAKVESNFCKLRISCWKSESNCC